MFFHIFFFSQYVTLAMKWVHSTWLQVALWNLKKTEKIASYIVLEQGTRYPKYRSVPEFFFLNIKTGFIDSEAEFGIRMGTGPEPPT